MLASKFNGLTSSGAVSKSQQGLLRLGRGLSQDPSILMGAVSKQRFHTFARDICRRDKRVLYNLVQRSARHFSQQAKKAR